MRITFRKTPWLLSLRWHESAPEGSTAADVKRMNFEFTMGSIAVGITKHHERYSAPPEVAKRLRSAQRAATVALQTLCSLNLGRLADGLEVGERVFHDYELSLAFARGLDTHRKQHAGRASHFAGLDAASFPGALIEALEDFRSACSVAVERSAPQRGNSATRTARGALIALLGSNFVYHYKGWFGRFPPLSQTGWAVSTLQNMLDVAEVKDRDAARLLRTHVEKQKKRAGGRTRSR